MIRYATPYKLFNTIEAMFHMKHCDIIKETYKHIPFYNSLINIAL